MKQSCGCELTDELIYKPCRTHWQQLHKASELKYSDDAKLNHKLSKRLGVKVFDA